MANDNHLLSVICYNITMINTKYYNEFFEIGQQKINFSFFELNFLSGLQKVRSQNVMLSMILLTSDLRRMFLMTFTISLLKDLKRKDSSHLRNYSLMVQRLRPMPTVTHLYGVGALITILQDFWTLSTVFIKHTTNSYPQMVMMLNMKLAMQSCL